MANIPRLHAFAPQLFFFIDYSDKIYIKNIVKDFNLINNIKEKLLYID